MLRFTVLVLALTNAGYYAWSHGLLPLGHSTSSEEAEPQRLAQQISPDALRIVPKAGSNAPSTEDAAPSPPTPKSKPEAAAQPPAAFLAPAPTAELATPAPAPTPPAPTIPQAVAPVIAAAQPDNKPEVKAPAKPEPQTICLQAGAFNTAQADTLRKALSSLPADSWNLNNATLPGRWMVYMGRFSDLNTLDKKRKELQSRDVPYDRPRIAALEPGLSLGRYSTEDAAERALAQLGTKGVRSARVVQERAETPAFVLRLPAVAVDARQRISATLRPALAGKTLRPCQRD